MPKLTERVVSALVSDPARETFHWDDSLKGFGLRVMPSGRKVFFIQYRNAAGRTKRLKIGVHGKLKAEATRSEALQHLARVETGGDPSRERSEQRRAQSMADLARDYLERHGAKKRPSSQVNDRSILDRIILPRLGRKLVAEVTRRHIEALHLSLHATPHQANRTLALASKMFTLAIAWGWRADNPVRGVGRYLESRRERWLDCEELARLTAALDRQPNQRLANAVRLLLLTGSRRREVLSAAWDQFDLARGVWTKPSHHTKQKRTEHVPLSSVTRTLLAGMRAEDTDGIHLFPGNVPGRPLREIKRFWRSLLEDAGIERVRIHDLRHTYASHLVSNGVGLALVGRLLGHTQIATTQRYAHLADDPLRAATERFGAAVEGLNRNERAPITRLGRA